jgi:hypothetical protein
MKTPENVPARAGRPPWLAWPTGLLALLLLGAGAPISCLSFVSFVGLLISALALFLGAMFFMVLLSGSETSGWRRRTLGGILLASGLALVCWSAWIPNEVFGSGRSFVPRPPADASTWPFSHPDPALAYWLWKHPFWEAAIQWLACGALVGGGIRILYPRGLALPVAASLLAAATGPIMLRVCLHLSQGGWPTWD